jgi:PAS domain S-box-containing protein
VSVPHPWPGLVNFCAGLALGLALALGLGGLWGWLPPALWIFLSIGLVCLLLGGLVWRLNRQLGQTAQKALAASRESEQQYQRIFQASQDGMPIYDPQGQLVEFNPVACQMYGYAAEEFRRLPRSAYWRATPPALFQTRPAPAPPETLTHGRGLGQRKDGSTFPAEVTTTPITYHGRPHRLTVIRDITAQTETYQHLAQLVADRTRDLATLYDMVILASTATDVERVLEQALERTMEAEQCAAAVVHLLEETPSARRSIIYTGFAAGAEPASLSADWLRQQNELLVVPDLAHDLRVPAALRCPGFATCLGAPMRVQGRLLGFLSVYWKTPQPLGIEETALLGTIADQLGVAMENVRLRQRAEAAAISEERQRLARELHDSVTQMLYSVALFVHGAQTALQHQQTDALADYLRSLQAASLQALKEMRLLLYQLHPAAAEEDWLKALALRLEAVEQRANVQAQLLIENVPALPPALQKDFYAIALEALNNALKHAAATAVLVRVTGEPAHIVLEVNDNGQGFDPTRPAGGWGLPNMRERAARLGAQLDIQSAPATGTRVRLCAPRPAGAPAAE